MNLVQSAGKTVGNTIAALGLMVKALAILHTSASCSRFQPKHRCIFKTKIHLR